MSSGQIGEGAYHGLKGAALSFHERKGGLIAILQKLLKPLGAF